MDKLKYDSFYKFLVSLGIILITLPFAGLIYISNFDVTLINEKDYEKLSDYSVRNLERKQRLFEIIDKHFTLILIVLLTIVIIGFIFLVAGGIYWFRMQRLLDKQLRSDTIKKEFEVQQLTPLEILNEKSKEIEEEEKSEQNTEADNNIPINETDTAPDSNKKSDTATPSGGIAKPSSPLVGEVAGKALSSALTRSDKLWKTLSIEAKVIEKLTQKYSSKYDIRSNIKIGDTSFDAIAFSKLGDKPDIVFEIKYYPFVDRTSIFSQLPNLWYLKKSYKKRYGKNCKLVHIIVCPKKIIPSLHIPSYYGLDFQFWAEEDVLSIH